MQIRRLGNLKSGRWGFVGDGSEMLSMLNITSRVYADPVDVCLEFDIVPFIDPFLEITGDDSISVFNWKIQNTLSPAKYEICRTLKTDKRPEIGIDWEQLNATPEAIRFQLSNNWIDCSAPQTAFELARFVTRQNEVGLIKTIETGITFDPNDQRWPRGDSLWHTRALDVDVGEAPCRWCVKIESITEGEIDPYQFRALGITVPANWLGEIPGMIHPELAPWDQMLFLWGADNAVRLRCPPGSLVSLWVYREPDATADGIRTLTGMFKGVTQIMDSPRTYENITRMY